MPLINLRRLLISAPVVAIAAALVYFLAIRDDSIAGTPRAALAETPAGAVGKVGVLPGQLARDFTAQTPDGETLRLSEFRGTTTMINFWASWCTSCLEELPEFDALQREFGPERLQIVAVNTGESSGEARKFINELGTRDIRYVMDPTLVVADTYGVFGMPTTVFVDADGIVRGVYSGHLRDEDLRPMLEAALKGVDAAEPDPRLRVVTTVARDRVLEVRAGEGSVDLRSKSLRCDDSYCADEAIDAIERLGGVRGIERYIGEDPPRIVVTFDERATSAGFIAEALAGELESRGDPLYERELVIEEK